MSLSKITENISYWISLVAEMILTTVDRLQPVRRMQIIEGDNDVFSIYSQGAEVESASTFKSVRLPGDVNPETQNPALNEVQNREVEIILRSSRFLIRPLDLPKRAGEFLDGIVRSQIDRLTPWSAADAVFGWTSPVEAPDGQISLSVVATAQARIEPYVRTLTRLGARSVLVSMQPEGDDGVAPIPVLIQGSQRATGIARVRYWLMTALAATSVAAAIATTAAQLIGDDLEVKAHDMNRLIAERRSSLFKGRSAAGTTTTAQRALEQRKHENAASVMVLEALSHALPDHTYLTELRIEGDKVQIVGATHEAPSLIRLMEASPHFARAAFFAPTMRAPAEPGERFHIETRVKPVFAVGQ